MESGAKERDEPALVDRRLAQLLEHPLRARIIAQPAKGSMTLPELAQTLGEPLPCVSYHAKVLEEAGAQAPPR
jgi:DNA-binding transcriptional ArsR family regulator